MSFPLFLEDWWRDKAKTIPMGMPCKIVSYSKNQGTCNVQPLFRREVDGVAREYPILSKVPILDLRMSDSFGVQIEYKTNDLVWVSFCPFDISKALGKQSSVESERTMGLENCVVIGKITGTTFTLPSGLIGAEDSKLYIKNNQSDYYTLFKALLTALKSLGTVGTASAQSVNAVTIAAIESVEQQFEQLFKSGN